jgi:hypothetical protein
MAAGIADTLWSMEDIAKLTEPKVPARCGHTSRDSAMRAKIIKLNMSYPTAQAVTENGIAVAFKPPQNAKLHLSDEIEIDLECVGIEQTIVNMTTGATFALTIPERDIHDVRLPMIHGGSRFPSLERRRGS